MDPSPIRDPEGAGAVDAAPTKSLSSPRKPASLTFRPGREGKNTASPRLDQRPQQQTAENIGLGHLAPAAAILSSGLPLPVGYALKRGYHSSATWTTSSGDLGGMSDTDDVQDRRPWVEEFNRLGSKNGFRPLVPEDYDGLAMDQTLRDHGRRRHHHHLEKRGWFSRTFQKNRNVSATSDTSSVKTDTTRSVSRSKLLLGKEKEREKEGDMGSHKSGVTPQRKRSFSDMAMHMVPHAGLSPSSYNKRDSLKDADLQSLVRLCGKSFVYLPPEYAPGSLMLPTCLRATAQYLVQHAPSTRGVFRIPGSSRAVAALYDYYACPDTDGRHGFRTDPAEVAGTVRRPELPAHVCKRAGAGVHDVASCFKRLLGGLPGGILGSLSLFDALVAVHAQLQGAEPEAHRTKQSRLRARMIALAVGSLRSRFRRELICAVFGLLCLIGRTAERAPREDEHGRPLPTSDLMGYGPLGIVFGPLLVGDLLAGYEMNVADPGKGLMLWPVTPHRAKPHKGKDKDNTPGKEGGSQLVGHHGHGHGQAHGTGGGDGGAVKSTVDKILVANSIAEMLITHWREVVEQMNNLRLKKLGILQSSPETLVCGPSDSWLRPSASGNLLNKRTSQQHQQNTQAWSAQSAKEGDGRHLAELPVPPSPPHGSRAADFGDNGPEASGLIVRRRRPSKCHGSQPASSRARLDLNKQSKTVLSPTVEEASCASRHDSCHSRDEPLTNTQQTLRSANPDLAAAMVARKGSTGFPSARTTVRLANKESQRSHPVASGASGGRSDEDAQGGQSETSCRTGRTMQTTVVHRQQSRSPRPSLEKKPSSRSIESRHSAPTGRLAASRLDVRQKKVDGKSRGEGQTASSRQNAGSGEQQSKHGQGESFNFTAAMQMPQITPSRPQAAPSVNRLSNAASSLPDSQKPVSSAVKAMAAKFESAFQKQQGQDGLLKPPALGLVDNYKQRKSDAKQGESIAAVRTTNPPTPIGSSPAKSSRSMEHSTVGGLGAGASSPRWTPTRKTNRASMPSATDEGRIVDKAANGSRWRVGVDKKTLDDSPGGTAKSQTGPVADSTEWKPHDDQSQPQPDTGYHEELPNSPTRLPGQLHAFASSLSLGAVTVKGASSPCPAVNYPSSSFSSITGPSAGALDMTAAAHLSFGAATTDLDILNEQLRIAREDARLWRERAERAERRVAVYERFVGRLKGMPCSLVGMIPEEEQQGVDGPSSELRAMVGAMDGPCDDEAHVHVSHGSVHDAHGSLNRRSRQDKEAADQNDETQRRFLLCPHPRPLAYSSGERTEDSDVVMGRIKRAMQGRKQNSSGYGHHHGYGEYCQISHGSSASVTADDGEDDEEPDDHGSPDSVRNLQCLFGRGNGEQESRSTGLGSGNKRPCSLETCATMSGFSPAKSGSIGPAMKEQSLVGVRMLEEHVDVESDDGAVKKYVLTWMVAQEELEKELLKLGLGGK